MESLNLDKDSIVAVGCDGTIINTGASNGVIHKLEILLKHPVHYFVCLLHLNELPFRAIFHHIDGRSIGPDSFVGPIGRRLKGFQSNKPVVNFTPIRNDKFPKLPDALVNDLSTDQSYLYRICRAVIEGNVSDDLAALEPGVLNLARWNTLWSRLLRDYISTTKTSTKQMRLVTVIIKFSAHLWFRIKCNPLAADGARIMFEAVTLLKELHPEDQAIAKKVIQRNGWFCHPDQLILAMVTDKENTEMRCKAVDLMENLRRNKYPLQTDEKRCKGSTLSEDDLDVPIAEDLLIASESDCESSSETPEESDIDTIRKVVIPSINWQAKSYDTIINLKDNLTSLPPLLANLSDTQLHDIRTAPFQCEKYPNNTQGVERAIRVMCNAATEVVGHQQRDGYMRARFNSRKLMLSFRTKRDYKLMD